MKKSAIVIAGLALTLNGIGQIQVLDTSLTPPGAPQDGIMKTIDLVEPRIALSTNNTPGIASTTTYEIGQSGSYYLTENLEGSQSETGILVYASNVTIDLNGFSLIGSTNVASPNNAPGIVVESNAHSVVIQNGTIASWTTGIIGQGKDLVVRNIRSTRNGTHGIQAGQGTYILDSSFYRNLNHGVLLGDNAVVQRVQVNTNDFGISVGAGSLVKDCTAYNHANHGITLNGAGSRAESCVTSLNNNGIEIKGDRCTVINCTSVNNRSEGIQCGPISGVGPTGCRIEGNHLAGNAGSGIFVSGTNNLIVANMAEGGNFPYFIVATNMVGQVVSTNNASPTTGSSGGNLGAGVGPWSNFAR